MVGVPERRGGDEIGEEEHDLLHLDGGLGQVEFGVLVENPLLEPLELGGWFDAQLVDEVGAKAGERTKRFGLSPRPVQRKHMETVDALTEGVVGCQGSQLGQGGDVTAERQLDLQALLHSREAHLLQAGDVSSQLHGVAVGVRAAAPQCQPAIE